MHARTQASIPWVSAFKNVLTGQPMMRQGQRWVTQPHGGMVGVRGCFSNGWSLLVSEREPSDMCMHRDGLKKLCERTKGKPKHRGGLTVVYGHLRCACCPLLFLVEFNPCRVSAGNPTRTYLRTVFSPFVSTRNKRFKN